MIVQLFAGICGAVGSRVAAQEGRLINAVSDRIWAALCWAAGAYPIYRDIWDAVIVGGGYLCLKLAAHGGYFIHPQDFDPKAPNIPAAARLKWIDWVLAKLHGNVLGKFVGMSLTGVYFAVAFVLLAWHHDDWRLALYALPFCLWMGLSYVIPPLIIYLVRRNRPVTASSIYDQYTDYSDLLYGFGALFLAADAILSVPHYIFIAS